MSLLLVLSLAGCKSSYDPRPVYDSVLIRLEVAETTERELFRKEAEHRLAILGNQMGALESIAASQVRVLLLLDWDDGKSDFRKATSWRAILGGDPSEPTLAGEQLRVRGTLRILMEQKYEWIGSDDASKNATAWDLFTRNGEFSSYSGSLAPRSEQLPRLRSEYETWNIRLQSAVIETAPVVARIREARRVLTESIGRDAGAHAQRIATNYGAMRQLTQSARDYAAALADNQAFIGVSHKVLSAVNGLIPAWGGTPKPAEGQ